LKGEAALGVLVIQGAQADGPQQALGGGQRGEARVLDVGSPPFGQVPRVGGAEEGRGEEGAGLGGGVGDVVQDGLGGLAVGGGEGRGDGRQQGLLLGGGEALLEEQREEAVAGLGGGPEEPVPAPRQMCQAQVRGQRKGQQQGAPWAVWLEVLEDVQQGLQAGGIGAGHKGQQRRDGLGLGHGQRGGGQEG
jgi:hypothetical protein